MMSVNMISLQRRYRLQRRVLHREVLRFLQFGAVQGRPLDNEPTHTRRQLAGDDREAVDRDKRPLVTVSDVEMGRPVVVVVERDDDPKKAAQFGHMSPPCRTDTLGECQLRFKDRLPRGVDAGFDIVIAHRAQLHQIDLSAERRLQSFLEPEIGIERMLGRAPVELDQKIDVVRCRSDRAPAGERRRDSGLQNHDHDSQRLSAVLEPPVGGRGARGAKQVPCLDGPVPAS